MSREEEVQRIAEICGELSLGAGGPMQYRATFSGFGGEASQVVAVPPEKVEGIFEAIWLRLKQSPEYRPLKAAYRERDKAHAEIARLSRDYNELRETHDRKAAETARLRAENEALREALKDAASRAHAVLARLSPPR